MVNIEISTSYLFITGGGALTKDIDVISGQNAGILYRVILDIQLRFVFIVTQESKELDRRVFQRMNIIVPDVTFYSTGKRSNAGRAEFVFCFEGDKSSVHTKSGTILLEQNSTGEVFTLMTEPLYMPPIPTFKYVEIPLGLSESHTLFLETVKDLGERAHRGRRYDLLKASGLIRFLF